MLVDAFSNLDLLSVGITVAATLILGVSAYFADRKNVTNRMFLGFTAVTACWGVVNFLSYQFSDPVITLWLLRGILFFAVLQAFYLYAFFAAFPDRTHIPRAYRTRILGPLAIFTALLTLTPLVFRSIEGGVAAGKVALVNKGPGLAVFALTAVGLVLAALYSFFRKFGRAQGLERRRIAFVLIGTAITFCLIIVFNLIFAAALGDPRYIPFGALFVFPFIAFSAYAILRQRFFDIKVAATSVLVFVLAIVSFGEIIFSTAPTLILFRLSIFVLVLVFGLNLIRSVIREVEQRELIQKQEKELEAVNAQQQNLLHFISHEVKGYLTKSAMGFAAIEEGDYGPVASPLSSMAKTALIEVRKGVETVTDILDGANMKKGTFVYNKAPFDLKKAVERSVEDMQIAAGEKKLLLTLTVEEGVYRMEGDEDKIRRHVIRNLIDNSIKYTPKGNVQVRLSREANRAIFSVKDTGVGITAEDMAHLFTEGGHGKNSIKVNVHSTGYGLFIAKQVVTAHGGIIHADSAGAGKGSEFILELPLL